MNGYRYVFSGHGYQLVRIVNRLLGVNFEPVFFEQRVDFLDESNQPFLSLLDETSQLHVVFYHAVPKFEGVTLEMVDSTEGIDHQWHYRGEKLEEMTMLIEIGLSNYKKQKNV